MSKKLIWLNGIICVLLAISQIALISNSVDDFDESKSWFELFKALFWMMLGVGGFWLCVNHLVSKKPIWKIWG